MSDSRTTLRGAGARPEPMDWLEANERRAFLLAVVVLAALTLGMFGDVLFATGEVLSHPRGDLIGNFVPWRQFGFGELRRGNLALWNPHIFSGSPYFGGFQSALLYPGNFLYLLLPLAEATNWTIVLHVFLGGVFMYLWTWHRGLHPAARLLAAVLFMFCGAHFLHIFVGHLPHMCLMAWGPLVLLSVDGVFRPGAPGLPGRPRRAGEPGPFAWCLLGVFAASMQILAGHPQYVFFMAVTAAIYSALRLVRSPGRWRTVLWLAAIPAGAAAVSAVQILAGFHAAGETVRSGGVPYSFAAVLPLSPENLLTAAVPFFFGNGMQFPYWGRWYYWEESLFVGMSGAVLAVLGGLLARREVRRFSVTMTAVCLVLALGAHTPLFPILYRYVPGFNMFRSMAKFIYPASLFIIMLAAAGLDELLRGPSGHPPARRWGRAAMGVAAVAALAGAGGLVVRASAAAGAADGLWGRIVQAIQQTHQWSQAQVAPGEDIFGNAEFVRNAGLFASKGLLVAAGTALLLAGGLAVRRFSRKAAFAVALLAAAEVFVFARSVRPTTDYDGPALRLEKVDPNVRRVAEILADREGDYRVLCEPGLNSAMVMPWDDIWGYDNYVTKRYAEFMAFAHGRDPDQASEYLQFSDPQPLDRMFRWRFAFRMDGDEMRVVEMSDPMGRLELIRQCRVIEGRDGIFEAMAAEGFDPRRTVILETPPEPRPEAFAKGGQARVVDSSTDHLTIEADLPAPAILLITDTYDPGWRAVALPGSVQDTYRLMPANYALRAVPLAAGKHRLRVEYSPLAFRAGVWISGVSAAAYLALLAWYAWRRKRPGGRDIVESNPDTCRTAQ